MLRKNNEKVNRMTMNHKIAVASVLGMLFTTFISEAETKLSIEFEQQHQVIDSFGASDAWSIDPLIRKWESEGKSDDIAQLADTLFSIDNGIGLSGWRFNIGAGSAEQGSNSLISLDNLGKSYRRAELLQPSSGADIDETKQLGQLRFLQEANQRGVQDFVAFSNSPPVWVTKNGLAHPNNGNGVGSTNLDADKVHQYANFLADVLTYLRDEIEVPVNYVSPVNEPTWEWQGKSQEGNRYNIDDLKSVYSALYDALEAKSLHEDVEIDAGEVVEYTAALSDSAYKAFSGSNTAYSGGMNGSGQGLYRNYIDELLGDETIRNLVGNKISLHGYHSDAWSDRMGELRGLVYDNVKSASDDAKIWMSEFSVLGGTGDVRDFEGNGWNVDDLDYALHIAKVIHRDLTRLNASAWHWWLGVTPYNYKDGLIKVNADLEANSIATSKVLWTLGQYSRFIRPDYIRIGLANVDSLTGVMASAYKSPDDSKIIVVATNVSTSEEALTFEFFDLPDGKSVTSLTTYITDKTNDLSLIAPTQIANGYNLPAKSIVTFVANIGDVELLPEASFIQSRQSIAQDGTVTFSSTSTHSPESFEWTFAGGTPETSTEANPEVTYAQVGSFDVTLKVTNAVGSDTITKSEAINVIAENPQGCDSEGYVNIETWLNLPDTGDYNYDSSVASIPLDTTPESETLSAFEIQADTGDNYATRIRGYVCAPITGEYTFWIASDNQGELWLSSDESQENISKIAYSIDWNNFREWDKYESQQSLPIYLIAGQKYFVETLHKEHDGGDNLSVGWQLPDGTFERPIAENRLSPFIADDVTPPTTTPPPTTPPSTEKSSGSGGGSNSSISIVFLVLVLIKKRIFKNLELFVKAL